MTKQEQINEMAKAMEHFELQNTYKCDIELAEHLYNKGYRKLPEDAVVLTREEYDKLGLFEETVQEYKSVNGQPVLVKERKTLKKYSTDIADFIRKRTAKEFAEQVKMAFYAEFDELIPSIMADKIDELLKEYEK